MFSDSFGFHFFLVYCNDMFAYFHFSSVSTLNRMVLNIYEPLLFCGQASFQIPGSFDFHASFWCKCRDAVTMLRAVVI